jgi:hypothetical protein
MRFRIVRNETKSTREARPGTRASIVGSADIGQRLIIVGPVTAITRRDTEERHAVPEPK